MYATMNLKIIVCDTIFFKRKARRFNQRKRSCKDSEALIEKEEGLV